MFESKKLNGTLISIVDDKHNCVEKRLTFKSIDIMFQNNELLYPPFQTNLDENRVEEMCISYMKNPDYLLFKNKIIIGVVYDLANNVNKLYVVDGQHRLSMSRILYNNNNINDTLNFCYYNIKSDEEMHNLFIEINKDSYKNSKYVSLSDFSKSIYLDLKNYLVNHKKIYFATNKNIKHKLYTISEFVDILSDKKYIDKFNNISDLVKDLEDKNNFYYSKIEYREYINQDNNSFYKEEEYAINNACIYCLKNNNFVEFLTNNTIPKHTFKNKKLNISANLRILCWGKYFGDNLIGVCPLCNHKIEFSRNGFHCGHIISEANGGETNLDNLRPICDICNYKMGKMNWTDYVASLV